MTIGRIFGAGLAGSSGNRQGGTLVVAMGRGPTRLAMMTTWP